MKKSSIVEAVMNEPISLGGFTWAHGFLAQRFAEQKLSLQCQNLLLMTAMRRGVDSNLPDTREIPEKDALKLWSAMGTGKLKTINRIFNKHWELVKA